MTKRIAIVCTTIFEPRFLEGYIEDIDRSRDTADVEMIIIPDRKTPATVAARCSELAKRGYAVHCPDLDAQEQFLKRFPSMAGRIPYDSDNRRNIGFLMALDHGAEVLISIDDDNFCIDGHPFVREHAITGEHAVGNEARSSDGWLNLCSLLEGSTSDEIFPRGFPYYARRNRREITRVSAAERRIAVNVGLWLSDPDVDAITRLAQAPVIHSAHKGSLFLGADTWTPINTQNTAIARDAVAAYYYVRMGFSLGGLKIDRYGDILSGYFLQKCTKARGEAIRVGPPIADHRRTPHNLFKDLYHELAGIVLLEDLLPWLLELKIAGSSYRDTYAALADALEERGAAMRGFVWDEGGREFLRETAGHMRAWLEAVSVMT
jgi:hypothetical protein